MDIFDEEIRYPEEARRQPELEESRRRPDAHDTQLYASLSEVYVQELYARASDIIAKAVERPSSCVPNRTIIATSVNPFHEPLLRLQLTSLPSCFCTRYVALCSGILGMPRITCLRWAATRASEFQRRDFVSMTWTRWELMHMALSTGAVDAVLWLDSDVLLVRNPFTAMSGVAALASADVIYQAEYLEEPVDGWAADFGMFSSNVNTGVLLVRNRAFVRAVLQSIFIKLDTLGTN